MAVYEGAPFPASALTLEPTRCLRIEQSAFFRLIEQDPAIVRGLLSGLTLRLAELTRRMAELTGRGSMRASGACSSSCATRSERRL